LLDPKIVVVTEGGGEADGDFAATNEALARLMSGRTAIVVATRAATAKVF
jgi:hypothetical protein